MKSALFCSPETELAPPREVFSSLGRKPIAAFILVSLLGLGLRFYHLTSQSLWQDEIGSIVAAETPLGRMYEASTKINNCLPTYPLLLSIFSPADPRDYDLVGRSLSAVAGALSVPLFMAVVYLWRRQQGVAVCAGLLLAVNPLHIWYSQEMRPYAIVLMLGLLTLLFFELARRDPKSQSYWWGLYLCAAFAAALFHKSGLIFPLLCFGWHGGELFLARRRFKELSIHIPIGLLMVLLQLVKSYPPGELYTRGRSILEIAYSLPAFLGGYSFGPSVTSIQTLGPTAAALRSLPELGIMAAALALAGAAYALNFRALRVGRETWLFALDLGIVAAYSVVSRFPFNVRYALPALL